VPLAVLLVPTTAIPPPSRALASAVSTASFMASMPKLLPPLIRAESRVSCTMAGGCSFSSRGRPPLTTLTRFCELPRSCAHMSTCGLCRLSCHMCARRAMIMVVQH